MELYLTLAIAVGGIATGIGAMWTAIVARRQLREQRQFLLEQNERARVNLQEDLMTKLWQQWMSPTYVDLRAKSIQFMTNNLFIDGDFGELEYVDAASSYVLDFFDQIGYLTKIGVVRIERAVGTWGGAIRLGWGLWEPAVEKDRVKRMEPDLHANYEYLYGQTLDFYAKRGGPAAPPTKEELRRFVEAIQQGEAELNSDTWARKPALSGEQPLTQVTPQVGTGQTS